MSNEAINRIKPEQVLQAYKETGLKPQQCSFFYRDCACGLAVLYRQGGGDLSIGKAVVDYAGEKYSKLYSTAFMDGFDGFQNYNNETFVNDMKKIYEDFTMEDYLDAYEDGKDSWELASKELL